MPVTYSAQQSKRLGAAIIKFLEHHKANKRLAPDQDEGLTVAMQCLTLVFDAVPSDAEGLPELMESYNQIAGETGIKEIVAVSDDDKKSAEEFKKVGNDAMKEKKYESAVDEYTKAIEKDSQNEMYYCNRAAAFTNLEKYHEALDDCKKAISINEDYAKAFSRMALIYSKLQFFEESVACYKTAITLEPNNESYKNNLEKVEKKAEEVRKHMEANNPYAHMTPEMQQQAAMMGMNAGAGAMGMPPGADPMAGMSPAMMNAYSEFAQNPQFAAMADKVMTNPEMKGAVEDFMKKAGIQTPEGGVGSGNPMDMMAQGMGQNASMDQLMALGQQFAEHMQKENPDLINELRSKMGVPEGAMPNLGGMNLDEKKQEEENK